MKKAYKTLATENHKLQAAKKNAMKAALIYGVSVIFITSVEVAVFISTINNPSTLGYLASAGCGVLVFSWLIHAMKMRYDQELMLQLPDGNSGLLRIDDVPDHWELIAKMLHDDMLKNLKDVVDILPNKRSIQIEALSVDGNERDSVILDYLRLASDEQLRAISVTLRDKSLSELHGIKAALWDYLHLKMLKNTAD